MQVGYHTTAKCSGSCRVGWRAARAGEPLPVHCTPQGTPQEGKRPLTSMIESSSSWNWLGSKIFSEMRSAGSASIRASTTMNSMALDFLQASVVGRVSVADRSLKAGHAPQTQNSIAHLCPLPIPALHVCTYEAAQIQAPSPPCSPAPLCVTITGRIRASVVVQDTVPFSPCLPSLVSVHLAVHGGTGVEQLVQVHVLRVVAAWKARRRRASSGGVQVGSGRASTAKG